MRIDGKAIAEKILARLKLDVERLRQKGIVPTLAVIQVGDNPASLAYIRQKQKAAEKIGANLILNQFPETANINDVNETIRKFNSDPYVHGFIIQRPIPQVLNTNTTALHSAVVLKDIDGFVPNSPFKPPVALAVLAILEEVFHLQYPRSTPGVEARENGFNDWLNKQCVTVLGRGETAGKPITDMFSMRGCTIEIIHSKTEHPEIITQKSPIIVSCVGKERAITKEMIMPESILIGVGIWRDSEGKLRGDYDEEEIKDIAGFYTPTPGGVGPVNVACLMQNLVEATKHSVPS